MIRHMELFPFTFELHIFVSEKMPFDVIFCILICCYDIRNNYHKIYIKSNVLIRCSDLTIQHNRENEVLAINTEF